MLYIFFIAALISFLGQLPLGNMSITATQIGIQEGFKRAWVFAIGVAIVEMLYLRFALTGMDWVVKHRLWFLVLGWVTVALFLLLGILSFMSARKQQEEKKSVMLNNRIHRFLLGLMMSALNPVQIPFWFLWTSTMIQTNVLPITASAYNVFTAGAGIGTIGGLALYIHGGNWLVKKNNTSNKTLNQIMGAIFIITALIQLYRMLYKPWI
ncbi:LysE family translocator [Sediminibacterium goheungense]|uniref:Threonine/homoserine/homoserine lactone efflux protein n=1 Tax=Sediminibacterium goheungense TaxID=1086393 RepID=A0A4R6IT53_9BACT|nr:LysE family transporter [Sediminibacterium goheungense]TDO25690.1 threonine/homoserine/homoserine lactone efflux protein [Sediminibacterium goheungense]